jgi:hypothetical protein
MVLVESETHGVRICHPEDWFYDDTFFIVMSSDPDVDLFAEGSQMQDGVVIIVFAGTSEEMAVDSSPDALLDGLAEQFAAETGEIEILSGPESIMINDIPVMTIDFATSEEGETGHGRIAFFDNGEQAAVFLAVSPVDQWEDHESTIEDILGCVDLFEGTGLAFDVPADENTLEMGTIAVGESMAGMLAEGEIHSWVLSAQGGEVVDIIATPWDQDVDLVVTVLGADGSMFGYYDQSGADEPEEIRELELDGGGDYFIRIEEFSDAGGSYTLEVVASDEGSSGPEDGGADWTVMGEVEIGQMVEASLGGEERHAWTLTAQSGDVVDIEVNPLSAEMDVTFSVVAPTGSPIVPQYDEGFTGEAEELDGLRLDWSGDYTIVVEEFWGEAGRYELRIVPDAEGDGDGDVLELGELAYGEVGLGTLPAGENLYHLWRFEGAAGDFISVLVRPQSSDADLMLGLLDPDGNVLVELVDDTAGDEPERITNFELVVTGTYFIVVTEYWDEYAEYELTLDLD